ncbi:MAG: hypothetical protein QM765_07925 [Myxococcales bacterium]
MGTERPEGQPITLFVPGPWSDAEACKKEVSKTGEWSIEWIENDGRFAQAFEFGVFPKKDLPKLDACPGAVVVEGRINLPREATRLEKVGRALAKAGGLAIRTEQSKAGWTFPEWLEQISAGGGRALFRALVVALTSRDTLETCGMHVFGRPDAEMAAKDLDEANRIVSALSVYQLDEDPLLLSGHTFHPDPETPRVSLERWPDARYPESHPCHNPFGIWRLGPPPKKARQQPELALVFMPTLVSLLAAAERDAGKPLTRRQVEAIRDGGTCVATPHDKVRAIEVGRGYADIDPELAWEQWQVIRKALS